MCIRVVPKNGILTKFNILCGLAKIFLQHTVYIVLKTKLPSLIWYKDSVATIFFVALILTEA